MKISVIIPALNEGSGIGASIAAALAGGSEVIVVDGGSSDDTCEKAQGAGARLIKSAPGRGLQMDIGALEATGDVFLFLHADTKLPPDWRLKVEGAFLDDAVVGGAFKFSVDSSRFPFRVLELLVAFRSKVLGLLYGDQAIFVLRETFFKIGGYKKLPLMEDVDCVNRLRKAGRVVLLDATVLTSARRWEKRGLFTTTLLNLTMLLFYKLGASPERLYLWYYGKGESEIGL